MVAGIGAIGSDHQGAAGPLQHGDDLTRKEVDALEEPLELRTPQLLVGVTLTKAFGPGEWLDLVVHEN